MVQSGAQQKKRLIRATLKHWRPACIFIWVVMVTWLIRFEAFPQLFNDELDGYTDLFRSDIISKESWMKMLNDGVPVGYAYTSIIQDDETPLEPYQITSIIRARLTRTTPPTPFRVSSTIGLDPRQRLQSFDISAQALSINARVQGNRLAGNAFEVEANIAGAKRKTKLKIPKGAIVQLPVGAIDVKRLSPGREIRVKTVDPISMKTTVLRMHGVANETITLSNGEQYDAYRIETRMGVIETESWVSEAGELIRQTTPLGLTMEHCTEDEAMKLMAEH